jgi:hypothetical protein
MVLVLTLFFFFGSKCQPALVFFIEHNSDSCAVKHCLLQL